MKTPRILPVAVVTAILLAGVLRQSGAALDAASLVSLFFAAGLTGWVAETYHRPGPRAPSRWAALLQWFVRHAGTVAVDHTHLLPPDQISCHTGTGIAPPPARCC